MITGRNRFNIYLLCVLAAFAVGCRTPEEKKEAAEEKEQKEFATLRVHLEVRGDVSEFSIAVPIYREKPVSVTVDNSPFLSEANVTEAKVVDMPQGGFSLEFHLDQRGTWLLENYTTTNPGKHFAVFSEFGVKPKQGRWLGAPIIPRRISTGILTLTPDASREEAEAIARGLNNLAKEMEAKSKW